jgi:hypothetical protein
MTPATAAEVLIACILIVIAVETYGWALMHWKRRNRIYIQDVLTGVPQK